MRPPEGPGLLPPSPLVGEEEDPQGDRKSVRRSARKGGGPGRLPARVYVSFGGIGSRPGRRPCPSRGRVQDAACTLLMPDFCVKQVEYDGFRGGACFQPRRGGRP